MAPQNSAVRLLTCMDFKGSRRKVVEINRFTHTQKKIQKQCEDTNVCLCEDSGSVSGLVLLGLGP